MLGLSKGKFQIETETVICITSQTVQENNHKEKSTDRLCSRHFMLSASISEWICTIGRSIQAGRDAHNTLFSFNFLLLRKIQTYRFRLSNYYLSCSISQSLTNKKKNFSSVNGVFLKLSKRSGCRRCIGGQPANCLKDYPLSNIHSLQDLLGIEQQIQQMFCM